MTDEEIYENENESEEKDSTVAGKEESASNQPIEETSETEEPVREKKKVKSWFAPKPKKEKRERKERKPRTRNTNPDPDSLGEKWNRMKMIRNGHVILKTLTRDPKNGDFVLEVTLVHRKELPQDAVAVTNEPHTFCLDTIKTSEWYQANRPKITNPKEAQFTARDAFLHMMTNKYDNAMDVRWNEKVKFDYKKLTLPILGLVAVVIIVILLGLK